MFKGGLYSKSCRKAGGLCNVPGKCLSQTECKTYAKLVTLKIAAGTRAILLKRLTDELEEQLGPSRNQAEPSAEEI